MLLAIILTSCSSPEERKVREWLNGKLTTSAEKIKSLEIVDEDSVLSLTPLEMMYNYCLSHQPIQASDTTYFEYGHYLYHAKLARSFTLDGKEKPIELLNAHEFEWRKLYLIKAKGESGTLSTNIEVILDVDGTPMLTGREYDIDLSLHSSKFYSINTIK